MSQLVAAFRDLNPTDQRSDDDLTSYLASAHPDIFSQDPQAVADYTRIQNDFAKSLLGPMDYVKQVVGSPIRAFAATEADLPKAIGTGSLAIARKLNLPAIQFDGGVHLVNTKDLAPEESPGFVAMTKLGEGIEAIGNKLSPDEVPALQDSIWATKIPSTFGSIAGFMLGGWIAKGLMKGSIKAIALAAGKDALEEALTKGTAEGLAKVAALKIANAAEQAAIRKVHLLAAGTLGAAASGMSAYQDALAHGATQGDAENAFFANLPVGATYGLPVAELLKPGSTRLGKMARDLGVGVGTMDAQQVLSNLIAKKLYDPNRDWTAGLAETTTAGGIATAALSLLSHKLMGKAQAPATDINQNQEAARYSERPGDQVWPAGIDPMTTYEVDPARKAAVADILSRESAGETGVTLDTAFTSLDDIAKRHLENERARIAAIPPPLAEPIPAPTAPTPPPPLDVTAAAAPPPATVDAIALSRNPLDRVTTPTAEQVAAQAKLDAIRAGATGTATETATVLPDLSKKRADALSQKPAHELTPGEFVQVATKKLQETGHQVPSEAELLAAHQYVVEKAVNNGADIPDRVLKAYPDLERQVAAAPPETPQAAATPPTSINSPNPENAELMNPQVAGLLNMVDFDKAKLVSGEKGVGQKNAPAFLATNDPEKLYQTVRAKEGNKNFTTMLGAFEAKDGTVKVGPAYENRGRRVTLPGEDGKPVSMTYDAAVKAGYKLVAAFKTNESHHSSDQSVAVTYSPAEWGVIRAEAESRMAAAKSTAAAMEQHITGVTMPVEAGAESKLGEVGHVPDTELPAKNAKAKPLEVVSDEEIKRLSKLVEVERFGKDQAALLWDEIGTGPIDADSALSTLESLLADPTDGPRLAARSLIFELEERNPNAPKNEIIELAAEAISRASDKAADESDFARRIVQAGTGDTSKEAGTETVSAGATAPGLEHPNAGANGAAIPPGAVGGGREQSVAATPADGAVGGWSSLKAARLLQIRWKQYLAEGARLKKEESTASAARFSERQPSQYLASDSDIVGRLNAVLDAGRTNGVDIKVLQAALGEKESGISTPGTVVLFLHDQYHPSTDNLVLGFHEIGHELFRLLRLNPVMEEAYHRGIEKLSVPEGFTPKLGEGVNVRYVTAEETLVERVARNLVKEGFNPNQAQSISERLVRFLKRSYMRASMAIQASFLGSGHVNPELAQAYFENRMRSFLAGDLAPMSFISFLGGAKLTPAQQGDTFHTGTGFAAQFNGDTGTMEYREALPSTVEAMKFNQRIAQEAIRYSVRPDEPIPRAFEKMIDPHMVGREFNTAPKVKEDIGALNALHEMYQAAWRVFEKIGLSKPGYTFEHLLEHFLGEDTSATKKIELRNADLVANGFPPVDPTLQWNDPSMPETSQNMSADKGLGLGNALRTKLSERRTREDAFLKTADEQINRKATQVAEVTKNYMNTDLQLSFAKTEVGRLLNQLRDDFRQGTNAAAKEGMLSQVIRQIDGKKPDKAYVDAINSLYKRLATDPQGRFIDMLQKVSDLGVDWKNTTAKEGLEFIKDIVAHTDADLEPLQKRALASIAVAFAKTNEHSMGLLELSRTKAIKDVPGVIEILRKAMENTADAIPNARKLAKQLPKLSKLADRLLTKFEDIKAEQRDLIDQRERARVFTQLHEAYAPVLADQLRQLEHAIGKKGTDWQATDGAAYLLALKPNTPEDQVLANEQVLKLDGAEGNSKLSQHIMQNKAWLDAQPENMRGAVWNTIAAQTRELERVVSFAQHETVIKRSVINDWFGRLADHARITGLPSMLSVAERFTRYLYQRDSRTPTAARLGGDWATKEANLMRSLGISNDNIPAFRRVVYYPILDFYKSHPEVLASFKTGKEREAAASVLPKIKEMLMQNPDLREQLKKPEVWKQVEAYVWQTYANVSEIFKVHGGLDLFFQETGPDGKAFERRGLGHPLFTHPQQVPDDVLRMYQTMRGKGWLGTQEDGKFKAGEVSAKYEADREAFSAGVDARMTAEILRDFVTPLTRKIRSAFYGPKQSDGIERLAGTSNVTKAFVASDGSLVKFAEHLYELESDGKNLIESQADFVGKTLEGFQGYFDSLHNQFKDYNAAIQNGIQLPSRMLMDARTSESWPSEWLEYMPLGHQNMQVIFSRLAAESAFGRDHKGMAQDLQNGIENFKAKTTKFDHLVELVRTNNLFAKGKELDAAIKRAVESDTEAKEKGWSYQALRQARENLRMAQKVKSEWLSLMKLDGGVALELRPWLQLLGADAGLTVQGPSTSFLHFTTFIQPFSKLGLSMSALRVIKESLSGTAATGLGSFMQMFGHGISWRAEQTRRLLETGYVPADALQGFNNAWVGALRDRPDTTNPASIAAFKAAVTIRTVLSQGIGHAKEGATTAYPSFKPHAPFSMIGQFVDAGTIHGFMGGFGDMVERAVEHFKSNPGNRTDPDFRFNDFTDLGYRKGFIGIGSEKDAYQFFHDSMANRGINLETVARDVLQRRERGENVPPINNDQFRALAGIVRQEVSLDAQGSRPTWLTTNPVLRFASPLLGWPITKMHDWWKSAFRNPDMTLKNDDHLKAVYYGMLPYLAIVPASIALAYLKDQFNAGVVGKKANREDPFTSFKGMLDALAWTGTLGGLEGDMLNAFVNGDTQRPFDVDHRVFLVSSLRGLWDATRNWAVQGAVIPDYATVLRPASQSLGGSGYLQYADIINHALSLDNIEARQNARINAGNYLRVAGRGLGMDVRVSSGGGAVLSNPLRPLIGQMVSATYANDALDFRDAYSRALAEAVTEKRAAAKTWQQKQSVMKDAKDAVQRAYAGRNPLRTVFASEPTEQEYQRLLAALNDDGRADVSDAMRLFNHYGQQVESSRGVGIAPSLGRKTARTGTPFSLDSVRRSYVGMSTGTPFNLDRVRSLSVGM